MPREQPRGLGERQPHDARVAAFEPRDERGGAALDRVAARLVERLAGRDVALDLVARSACANVTCDADSATSTSSLPAQRDARSATSCVRPDSCASIARGVVGVRGLAEDRAVEHDLGVGAEHRARGEPALLHPLPARSVALVRAMRST